LFLFFYHTVAIALTNCTHSTNQYKWNTGKTTRSLITICRNPWTSNWIKCVWSNGCR